MESNQNGTSFGYGEDILTNGIKRRIDKGNLFLYRYVLLVVGSLGSKR